MVKTSQRGHAYIFKNTNKTRKSTQNMKIEVNKEIEILKKKQTVMIEMKNTIGQIKFSEKP